MDNSVFNILDKNFSKIIDFSRLSKGSVVYAFDALYKAFKKYREEDVGDMIRRVINTSNNPESFLNNTDYFLIYFPEYDEKLYIYDTVQSDDSFQFIDHYDNDINRHLPITFFNNPTDYDIIIYKYDGFSMLRTSVSIDITSESFYNLLENVTTFFREKFEIENNNGYYNIITSGKPVSHEQSEEEPLYFDTRDTSTMYENNTMEKHPEANGVFINKSILKESPKDEIINCVNDSLIGNMEDNIDNVLEDLCMDYKKISDAVIDLISTNSDDYTYYNYLECKLDDIIIVTNNKGKAFGIRIFKKYNSKGEYKYNARVIKNIDKCCVCTNGKTDNKMRRVMNDYYSFSIFYNNHGAGFSVNNIAELDIRNRKISQMEFFLYNLSNFSIALMDIYIEDISFNKYTTEIGNLKKEDYKEIKTTEDIMYELKEKCLFSSNKISDIIQLSRIFDNTDIIDVMEFAKYIEAYINKKAFLRNSIIPKGVIVSAIIYFKLPSRIRYYYFGKGTDGNYYICLDKCFDNILTLNGFSKVSFFMSPNSDTSIYIPNDIKYNNKEFISVLYKAIKFWCYTELHKNDD